MLQHGLGNTFETEKSSQLLHFLIQTLHSVPTFLLFGVVLDICKSNMIEWKLLPDVVFHF